MLRRTLLDRIVSGVLPPGAPLSPAELAPRLGASATPLREALIELAHDGFLDTHPGRGFVVRTLTPEEAGELYPLIWTLEGLAVRTAPPNRALLEQLARVNGEMGRTSDPSALQLLDARWHALLVSQCRNPTLHQTLDLLRMRVARYERAYVRYSGRMPESVKQHGRIIRALRAGRLRAAIALLEENWRVGPEFLVPWLQRVCGREGAAIPSVHRPRRQSA